MLIAGMLNRHAIDSKHILIHNMITMFALRLTTHTQSELLRVLNTLTMPSLLYWSLVNWTIAVAMPEVLSLSSGPEDNSGPHGM